MPRFGAASTSSMTGHQCAPDSGCFIWLKNDAREDILTNNYPFFTQNEHVNLPYDFAYNLDTGIARATTVNLPRWCLQHRFDQGLGSSQREGLL